MYGDDEAGVDFTTDATRHAAVRVRHCTIGEIPLLAPIDLSSTPLFVERGHPEFALDEESIPIDVATEAIADDRLLACDLVDSAGTTELIGWLVMFDRPNNETSIGQISVHASHMGKGHGQALMHAAIERCRRLGRSAVVLNTQRDVPWNQPWYERFGFVVVPPEEWDDRMADATHQQTVAGLDWTTRVHMRLRLT